MALLGWVRAWNRMARALVVEAYVLYLACRDPRVPWHARLLALFVVGYAFSPVDLVPDFIPLLGYLDDLLLVPLGILLVRRMIPGPLLAEHRMAAMDSMARGKPRFWAAAWVIIAIWLGLAGAAVVAMLRMYQD